TTETGDDSTKRFSYGARHLRMLETYGPPSLIVDEAFNVVHRSATAGRYLHLGSGEPSHNVIDLSRGDLRLELRTALHTAFETGLPTSRRVRMNGEDGGVVSLRVHPPVVQDDGARRFAMVVFEEEEQAEPAAAPADPIDRQAIVHLE